MSITPYNQEQARNILEHLGYRCRTIDTYKAALLNFKEITRLKQVNTKLGPQTTVALNLALHRHQNGQANASAHFSFEEGQCKCGGRYASCRGVWFRPEVLTALERLRAAKGQPIRPVSWFRCPGHNAATPGAAKRSQHMQGKAVDVPTDLRITEKEARAAGFRGVGIGKKSGFVAHVDVRLIPARWFYADL